MLEQITPVLLTFNEEPNIARTLSRLAWARDIVVVDSGSTDATVDIVKAFANARLFSRPFDTHAGQWRHAVENTGINTPWILRLDADYQISDAFAAELNTLAPDDSVSAFRVRFDYAIFSRRLVASLYPPNTILLRRGRFEIEDRGHTEGWIVDGSVCEMKTVAVHDDWKSTGHFVRAQADYMRREIERLDTHSTRLVSRLRLVPPVMPIAVFFYCLFGKGLILNGRAGIYYTLQRVLAEIVLSLMLLERRLRPESKPQNQKDRRSPS